MICVGNFSVFDRTRVKAKLFLFLLFDTKNVVEAFVFTVFFSPF